MRAEEMDEEAIDYILDHIKDGSVNTRRLNAWERTFVESIDDQWTRNRRLSERQKEVLGNIWEKCA